MRKPLYFDGAPDLFSRTKALFDSTSRLQVRYETPDPARHALPREGQLKTETTRRWTVSKRAGLMTDIVWG
jgi:hypothetical protein